MDFDSIRKSLQSTVMLAFNAINSDLKFLRIFTTIVGDNEGNCSDICSNLGDFLDLTVQET